MAQAMMEYAKPMVELAHARGRDINEVVQIAVLLWNYTTSLEEGEPDPKIERSVLKDLKKNLKMNEEEASDLLKKMLQRKDYLFPPDNQPLDRFLPFMFIRKEVRHLL